MIDSLAKQAVQQGGEYALGVPTTVDSVNLSLVGGSLQMNTLNVSNPEGYKSDHLMRTGKFNIAVQPGSVLTDTVRIPTFELDGLDMNIEGKALKTNVAQILDHVKKMGGGDSGAQPQAQPKEQPKGQGGGKKVVIDRLVIRNVVAHVVLGLPGAQPLTVNVPSIEMKNVGSDKPINVAELIGQLIPAIMAGVLEQGKGIIPGDMLAGLQADVAGTAAALGGQAAQMVQQASATVTAQLGGALQQVSKVVPGAVQGLVPGAGNQAQGAPQEAQKAATDSLQQAVGGGAAASQPAGGVGKSLEGLFKKDK
jgi:hypothetical protein